MLGVNQLSSARKDTKALEKDTKAAVCRGERERKEEQTGGRLPRGP
jgi:hypothetical protein